jgi:predicted Ser/Thr protein kinase
MSLEQLGKYKIIRTIGEGGFGVVYLAEDNIGLQVALKVLHPQVAADEMLAAYFKREAKALARLSHPNIVSIHGYDEIEGRSFIVMEYIEGTSLSALLASGQTPPLPQVLSIFRQALSALDHAHNKGVIHRDMKPANMILTVDGKTKIADFGIARLADSEKLTRTGTGAGSLLYMSPEQIKGKDIDLRSDIYSVGVSLYQILTGTCPFTGDSDYEIMSKQLNDPPPPLRQLRPDLPESLEALILKAMSKKKEDRFQTAAEMANALDRIKREIGVESVDQERTEVSRHVVNVGETVLTPTPGPKFPVKLIGAIGGVVILVLVVLLFVVKPFGKKEEKGGAVKDTTQVAPLVTFGDSLRQVREAFKEAEYQSALSMAATLSSSASASAADKLQLLKIRAAADVMLGDSSSADREFASLWSQSKTAVFAAAEFPAEVASYWKKYQESQHPVSQEVNVAISVSNWSFFKPVEVSFDGKSKKYNGGEIDFTAKVRTNPYEVMVLADVYRFTDTVYVTGGNRSKTIKLSRDQSTLKVTARNVSDPDEFVYAQVYVDGQIVKDKASGTTCDTPCDANFYDGPHKVWIKHERYQVVDPPKYLNLTGSTRVEFRVRPR